jgi:hypothetical protein
LESYWPLVFLGASQESGGVVSGIAC